MKRINTVAMALFIIFALGACTEVPVKEVKKCTKVVDVEMFQNYFLGFLPERDISVYKILDNGKRIRIDHTDYYQWGVANWLKTVKMMEVGNNYCWTEYERIK